MSSISELKSLIVSCSVKQVFVWWKPRVTCKILHRKGANKMAYTKMNNPIFPPAANSPCDLQCVCDKPDATYT